MKVVIAIACTGCVSFSIPDGPACGTRALAELNTSDIEIDPWLSPDRLEILFVSDRPGGPGNLDIYRATRNSVDDPFGSPLRLSSNMGGDPAVINTGADEHGPFIADDGTTLYFTRTIGLNDVVLVAHRATRNVADFDPPIAIGVMGNHVSLTPDQLDIYFDRDGDIYVAHRSAIGAAFDAAQLVNVRGMGPVVEPSISANGQTLLFGNDPQATGFVRITRATRGPAGDFGHLEELGEPDPVVGTADRSPQLHRPAFAYPDETIVFASTRVKSLDLWIACE